MVITSALHATVLGSIPGQGMGMFGVKTWLSTLGTVYPCVNSLCNIRSRFNKKCLFLFKSSKELTLVVRSGKDQNCGYPKW